MALAADCAAEAEPLAVEHPNDLVMTLLDALWPRVLSLDAERTLEPGQTFKECAVCPEMVVVPPGEFVMGSLQGAAVRGGKTSPNIRSKVIGFRVGRTLAP